MYMLYPRRMGADRRTERAERSAASHRRAKLLRRVGARATYGKRPALPSGNGAVGCTVSLQQIQQAGCDAEVSLRSGRGSARNEDRCRGTGFRPISRCGVISFSALLVLVGRNPLLASFFIQHQQLPSPACSRSSLSSHPSYLPALPALPALPVAPTSTALSCTSTASSPRSQGHRARQRPQRPHSRRLRLPPASKAKSAQCLRCRHRPAHLAVVSRAVQTKTAQRSIRPAAPPLAQSLLLPVRRSRPFRATRRLILPLRATPSTTLPAHGVAGSLAPYRTPSTLSTWVTRSAWICSLLPCLATWKSTASVAPLR